MREGAPPRGHPSSRAELLAGVYGYLQRRPGGLGLSSKMAAVRGAGQVTVEAFSLARERGDLGADAFLGAFISTVDGDVRCFSTSALVPLQGTKQGDDAEPAAAAASSANDGPRDVEESSTPTTTPRQRCLRPLDVFPRAGFPAEGVVFVVDARVGSRPPEVRCKSACVVDVSAGTDRDEQGVAIADGFMSEAMVTEAVLRPSLAAVSSVGARFFADSRALLQVIDLGTLENVRSIGVAFLRYATALTEVDFGPRPWNRLESIGDGCLCGCGDLRRVLNLSSLRVVQSVGAEFVSNSGVEVLDFGDEVWAHLDTIGDAFASYCPRLAMVKNLGALRHVSTLGDTFMVQAQSLEELSFGSSSSSTDCWSSLRSIPDNFLSGSFNAAACEITLAPFRNVESIGDACLAGARSLMAVDLGEEPWPRLRRIGENVMNRCDGLHVVGPLRAFRSVSSIGKGFLHHSRQVEDVDFGPDVWPSLREIGDDFLGNKTALESVGNLASLRNVQTVGSGFLAAFRNVETMDFGVEPWSNLESIGHRFLYTCRELRHLRHVASLRNVTMIGDEFAAGTKVVTVDFGLSDWHLLRVIGTHFFRESANLESIGNLGALRHAAVIGASFFCGAESLRDIDFGVNDWVNLKEIPPMFFERCRNLSHVHHLGSLHGVSAIRRGFLLGAASLREVSFGKEPWARLSTIEPEFLRGGKLRRVKHVKSLPCGDSVAWTDLIDPNAGGCDCIVC